MSTTPYLVGSHPPATHGKGWEAPLSKLFPDADDPPAPSSHVDDGLLKAMEEANNSLQEADHYFQELKQGMELHRREFDGQSSTLIIAVPEGL
jgi:hypothetical protein